MGNKGAKGGKGSNATVSKKTEFSKKEIDFLVGQTGLSKVEITQIYEKFNANNPDHLLDRNEFVRLYDELRPEPPELLNEISQYVFRAFDSDHNGINCGIFLKKMIEIILKFMFMVNKVLFRSTSL